MKIRFCFLALLGCFALGLLSGCNRQPASARLAARINGQPLTLRRMNQVFAEQTSSQKLRVSAAQRRMLKLSLLRQLIDRRIMLQYATRLNLTAPAGQVQTRLEQIQLQQPHWPPAEQRRAARDQVILSELFQREISAHIQVSPASIAAFYHAHASAFHVAEPEYHLAEIMVSSQPGAVANLNNDKARTPLQARRKIEMIARRLRQGGNFAQLAEQYSENPNNAASGGDLGLIPRSALISQVPVALQQAILALRPGQVSPVIESQGRYYILKLLDIIPAGNRRLRDPRVQAAIRQQLERNREQLLRAAFLSALRAHARIRNYYAERILSAAGVQTP